MDRPPSLPPLPRSWSGLSWRQLTDCWSAKIRYGGNGDAARVAALLSLCGLRVTGTAGSDGLTGEDVFVLEGGDGRRWTVTAREASHLASLALPWFDYPYGDPGEDAVKDEHGKVVREAREPVAGYVNPAWRDAMRLPLEELTVCSGGSGEVVFALPQIACNNLTWQQYRSLQALVPQLWQDGVSEDQRMLLQAQFLAHCLVPEQPAEPGGDPFRPAHVFRYDIARAEQSVTFWQQRTASDQTLFHICFQAYQTAVQYYSTVYRVLFGGSGKSDPLHDALTGEVGTLNAVMKYAGYSSQQEVYDSSLPFVLDILNTMARDAEAIEKMNRKIKKRN